MRGGMKEGRPPHPQLRAPPPPSSSLWTVPDESWKPWQQAHTQESAKKKKKKKEREKKNKRRLHSKGALALTSGDLSGK